VRVLIGCEFSGIVRDAFAALGHDAYSCDLLPTERPGKHLQGDIRGWLLYGKLMGWKWDLAIFHPPCTYTTVAANRWMKVQPGRKRKQEAAIRFFKELMDSDIERIAMEQPISVINTRVRKPDQIIHPFQFGHPENKSTCLWLKNLPPLRPTRTVRVHKDVKKANRVHHEAPGPDRWKNRSRTYTGIARARWHFNGVICEDVE
jgi:hypothetical protein